MLHEMQTMEREREARIRSRGEYHDASARSRYAAIRCLNSNNVYYI
jgi:hypothetical protein